MNHGPFPRILSPIAMSSATLKNELKINRLIRSSAVFILDPRLVQDTVAIGDFPLCRLLLSNDSNYPWFILVPRRPGISELFQLEPADQLQLWQETNSLAQLLSEAFNADKLNVGALGNVVSQLHMHVIVRFRNDAAWPAPVWGKHPAQPYTGEALSAIQRRLRQVLTHGFRFEEDQA
jgi:diadenosine tetraphosphate (Ap4A) HIT family hydrolase